MSRSGGERGRAVGSRPRPRLAPVPVAATRAADPDCIDEALEGLVAAVDDLVRDLEDPDSSSVPYLAPARPAPERVHGRAFTLVVVGVLILFELVVLAWLLPNL